MNRVWDLPSWAVWAGGVALSAALTALAYGGLVGPSHDRQRQTDAMRAELAEQAVETRRLEAGANALARSLEATRRELADQPRRLGDRRALNQRIADLIELAGDHGLEVLQLEPGPAEPGTHFTLVPLRLEAEADFAQHLSLLDTLHRVAPDLAVAGLSLRTEPRAEASRPRAEVRLVWFTATDPDGPPAAETPRR
ncbi:MAG: GspMb/PilO family protein [Planctomycetota bacterium]